MQRSKGRSFEQLVADAYRTAMPAAVIRRSLQAHQPFEPDVVVEHPVSHALSRLWTECQHANEPAPLVKLAQAERDIIVAGGPRLPVVVWRKTRGKTVQVTTRIWVLGALGLAYPLELELELELELGKWTTLVVTVDFYEWLALISSP